MATQAEKEQLIETLKFTPRDITISLSGYGGEIVIGRIDKATAKYWSERDDLEEYANKWDDEQFSDVPKEFDFIEGNSWYEVDNVAHGCAIEMSEGCWITVTDELENELLLETELDPDTLTNTGCTVSEWEDVDVETLLEDSGVFVGQNTEKGLFFEATFEITRPFDPALLEFHYSTYDGWRLLDGVQYDGEDLEGQDALSTTGKSSSFNVYVDDDYETLEGEETQVQRLVDEAEEDSKPQHKSTLNPDAKWPF